MIMKIKRLNFKKLEEVAGAADQIRDNYKVLDSLDAIEYVDSEETLTLEFNRFQEPVRVRGPLAKDILDAVGKLVARATEARQMEYLKLIGEADVGEKEQNNQDHTSQ